MIFKLGVLTIIFSVFAFSSCGDNKTSGTDNQALSQQDTKAKAPAEEAIQLDGMPSPIKQVQPEYPEAARKKGVEGKVFLKVLVGEKGDVKDVKLMKNESGSADLEKAAIAAVKKWEFKPATLKQKPVEVWVVIPIDFKLSKDKDKKVIKK